QATVRGSLAYMNHGYLASDILAVSSSALLFATGYEGLVLAFKQSEITVLAGSTLPTSLSFTRSFYMLAHGYHVQEGQIDWSLRNQIQKLTAQPIRTDAARGFLSSPRCGKGECPTDQPEIEQLIQDLNSWHEDAAKSHADTDGVLEAWSNTYGKLLGLADLPWLDALVSAMELKKSYYQTLDHILEHDGKSCAL
ncbi:MAG: hypothetical protein ACXWP5_10695, partial [Bdellovibrionota bacterium]